MSIKLYDKSGSTPQEILLAGNSNVDQILNGTSKNAIANKTVYNALQDKVEKSVNDLLYYYTTSDTYNKAEVRQLIGAINTLTIEVVAQLPTSEISTTTIYFVGPTSGKYDEYVYVNNTWVKIGDTEVDLSDYLEIADFNVAIADYYTKAEIDLMIAGYYNKTQVDTALAAKQDVLTFDTVPISGSSNPITSGGVYNALQAADEDIWEVMGQRGAKNLNSYPYYHEDNKVINDVTFTVNPTDGSVTANGTASADTTYIFHTRASAVRSLILPNGNYIVTGCPAGGSSTTYRLNCNRTSGGQSVVYGSDTGSGLALTLAGDDYDANKVRLGFYIYISSGTQLSNIVFKPMIRLAEDIDSTYQPYALTNQQITPYVQSVTNPNLLDNPWFTVNQRGLSTYTGTSNFIAVDRWRFTTSLTVTINADSTITVTNSLTGSDTWFAQAFVLSEYGLKTGDIVTQSIMMSDGTIYSHTAPIPAPDGTNDKVINEKGISRIRIQQLDNGRYHCVFYVSANSNATIRAIKLEKGTVSTLAMDVAPNYATELLKCQRYFKSIPIGELGGRLNSNGDTIRLLSSYTENMRSATKTAQLGDQSDASFALNVVGAGTQVALTWTTDFTISYDNHCMGIILGLTSTGKSKLTALKGNSLGVWIYANSIWVSADL